MANPVTSASLRSQSTSSLSSLALLSDRYRLPSATSRSLTPFEMKLQQDRENVSSKLRGLIRSPSSDAGPNSPNNVEVHGLPTIVKSTFSFPVVAGQLPSLQTGISRRLDLTSVQRDASITRSPDRYGTVLSSVDENKLLRREGHIAAGAHLAATGNEIVVENGEKSGRNGYSVEGDDEGKDLCERSESLQNENNISRYSNYKSPDSYDVDDVKVTSSDVSLLQISVTKDEQIIEPNNSVAKVEDALLEECPPTAPPPPPPLDDASGELSIPTSAVGLADETDHLPASPNAELHQELVENNDADGSDKKMYPPATPPPSPKCDEYDTSLQSFPSTDLLMEKTVIELEELRINRPCSPSALNIMEPNPELLTESSLVMPVASALVSVEQLLKSTTFERPINSTSEYFSEEDQTMSDNNHEADDLVVFDGIESRLMTGSVEQSLDYSGNKSDQPAPCEIDNTIVLLVKHTQASVCNYYSDDSHSVLNDNQALINEIVQSHVLSNNIHDVSSASQSVGEDSSLQDDAETRANVNVVSGVSVENQSSLLLSAIPNIDLSAPSNASIDRSAVDYSLGTSAKHILVNAENLMDGDADGHLEAEVGSVLISKTRSNCKLDDSYGICTPGTTDCEPIQNNYADLTDPEPLIRFSSDQESATREYFSTSMYNDDIFIPAADLVEVNSSPVDSISSDITLPTATFTMAKENSYAVIQQPLNATTSTLNVDVEPKVLEDVIPEVTESSRDLANGEDFIAHTVQVSSGNNESDNAAIGVVYDSDHETEKTESPNISSSDVHVVDVVEKDVPQLMSSSTDDNNNNGATETEKSTYVIGDLKGCRIFADNPDVVIQKQETLAEFSDVSEERCSSHLSMMTITLKVTPSNPAHREKHTNSIQRIHAQTDTEVTTPCKNADNARESITTSTTVDMVDCRNITEADDKLSNGQNEHNGDIAVSQVNNASLQKVWRVVEVEIEKGSASGLGFCIEGGDSSDNADRSPIIVKTLYGDCAAQRALRPGDELLKVGDVDLTSATYNKAVNALRSVSPGTVKLSVRRLIEEN